MGVLPHARALNGPHVADTNHVVLLHMPKHCGQGKGEQAHKHGEWGSADGVVSEGHPKHGGLQGEREEKRARQHGGNGGPKGVGECGSQEE